MNWSRLLGYVGALTLAAFIWVCLFFAVRALANEAVPTPAPTPKVAELVPAWKLAKAVAARDAARLQARQMRRALAHDPSVQEAKALAVVLYGVPRSELDYTVHCESTDNPRARNGRYRGSMQLGPIFEGTPFGQLDVFSPYVNILAGAYIWRTGHGWAPWECSPHGAFQP